MSIRIGLISDPHATASPVAEALSLFESAGVSEVLCAGDIAGYGNELDQTVNLLIEANCSTILGNHDIRCVEESRDATDIRTHTFLSTLPSVVDSVFGGKTLYMVHASPPCSHMEGIRLLDAQGDILVERKQMWGERLREFSHDILVVGHTHQVFAERLANTLVVNPGSTKFNHSCAILELPDMTCQVLPLSGRDVAKTWSWGTG